MTAAFDPITLEVLWTRIISVVDEAAKAIVRTSFSTLSNEANDFACVLTDARGNALAQNSGSIPSFIGTLPATVRHFLKEIGPERMRPGDVLITNDPWQGTGHMSDVSLVKPIFHRGTASERLVAFSSTTSHMPDIGGRVRAIEARELFEEGLHIPLTWLRRGKRGGRDAAAPHPRQRPHPRPDGGRHLGAGERQRADGRAGAPPPRRLRARRPRCPRRRAVRARRAGDEGGDSRGPGRHLPLRPGDRRLREAVSLRARAHREGGRDRRGLHGHLARPAAGHQLRPRLHLCDDGVRGALRPAPRPSQQRGHVPPGDRDRAGGLHSSTRSFPPRW